MRAAMISVLCLLTMASGCVLDAGGRPMDLIRDPSAVAEVPPYTADGTAGYCKADGKTVLPVQTMNHILRELQNLIEALGGTCDPLDDEQIATLLLPLIRVAGAWTEMIEVGKDPDVMPPTYLNTIDVETVAPAVYRGRIRTGAVFAKDGFYTNPGMTPVQRIASNGDATLGDISGEQVTVTKVTTDEIDALPLTFAAASATWDGGDNRWEVTNDAPHGKITITNSGNQAWSSGAEILLVIDCAAVGDGGASVFATIESEGIVSAVARNTYANAGNIFVTLRNLGTSALISDGWSVVVRYQVVNEG